MAKGSGESVTRLGVEWVVEASGCDAVALADLARMRALLERIITDLDLHVVGQPQWHKFPGPGGVTGLYLLSESHVACHTYPEHGGVTINLYCCRERPNWAWEQQLRDALSARHVQVRMLHREVS